MKANIVLSFTLVALLLLPLDIILAEGFVRLVGIPGVDPNTRNTEDFIKGIYWLAISIAAFLAVLKIILAGAKYMFSDIVTTKGESVKDIRAAVFGLIIVLSAVLILQTINPELNQFNFLKNAPPVNVIADGNLRALCAKVNSDGSCEVTKLDADRARDRGIDLGPGSITETYEFNDTEFLIKNGQGSGRARGLTRENETQLLENVDIIAANTELNRKIDESAKNFGISKCGCVFTSGSNTPTGCLGVSTLESADKNKITFVCKTR